MISENVNISYSAQQRKHEYINKLELLGTPEYGAQCLDVMARCYGTLDFILLTLSLNKFESFFFVFNFVSLLAITWLTRLVFLDPILF